MGKRSTIVSLFAFSAIIIASAFAWHIGLQQAYAQQKVALENFIELLQLAEHKVSQEQQQQLALQQGFNLYRILRNQDNLISVIPNDHLLPQSLILQTLKQKKGFLPQTLTPEGSVFYKLQVNESITLLASASLEAIRENYIQATKQSMFFIFIAALLFVVAYLTWVSKGQQIQQKRKHSLNKDKQSLGIYFKLNSNFQIVECNDEFIEIFPGSLQQNIRHLVKHSEREKTEQYLSQVISSKTLIDFECTLVRQQTNKQNTDQQEYESRWALRAKPLDTGKEFFIIISADDISKRHHMELELRRERNRMHTYLNTMHTLLVITDRQGKIIEANRQFVELIGNNEKKVLNKSISHFCPNRSHHQINNYLRNLTPEPNNTVSAEFPLVANTGKEFTIDWRITSLPNDDNSEEILLTGLDITESVANNQALKSANLQIREALRSAENANQSKSVFLANMSHEIRTPMNGILGATELILDQAIDEEQKQYIDIIHSSSHALLNIINDILDLSKIESGCFELEQINFDLHQLCNDVYQLFSSTAKQKGIQVLYFYGADLPQFWIGDPNRIRQILNNLFSNALKFTHQGRIDIRVQGVRLANHQFDVKIQIKDSGIGIAEKKIEQIFSAFQQADTSTSRKYGGTGLGLTISQHLANAMHGKIEVESELGLGSTFTLNLPLKPGTIEVKTKRSGLIRNYQAKVLLAEDNAVNSKIASKILNKLGIEATPVENGELALQETIDNTFDLILMDINMPIMDGITAAEKIRELSFPKNQVPILALTANAMMEDKERCLNAGMNGFISKPIKLARLIEELDAILSNLD